MVRNTFYVPNKYKERKLPSNIFKSLRRYAKRCNKCGSKNIKGMAGGKVLCRKCLLNAREKRKYGAKN